MWKLDIHNKAQASGPGNNEEWGAPDELVLLAWEEYKEYTFRALTSK